MKPKLKIDLTGPDGNVYAVIAIVSRVVTRSQAEELKVKAFSSKSYADVLKLCEEYADITWKR